VIRFFRCLRFRTRTLLILTTLVCVVLGTFAYQVQQARRARLLMAQLSANYLRVGLVLYTPRTFFGFEADKISYWKRFADWLGEPFLYERIDHMNFQGKDITDKEIVAIASLLPCENFCLHHSQLSDATMTKLVRMPLRSLWLCELDTSPDTFAKLADMTTLCEMRIAGPAVNDALLARTPDLKHLYELSLDISHITVSGFQSIARMPNLRYLQIGGRNLTDADIDDLAGMTRLERLDICGSGLTDAGLEKLTQLPNLNSIMLYNNPITKASLGKLEQLPHLTSLDIRSTQIEEDSLPALARFTNLKHLDIDIKNNFSKKGRQQLRAALPNCIITLHTPDRPRMATPFVDRKKRTWSNLEAPKISTQTSFTLNTWQRHDDDDD
jgi:hypothetical protein